MHLLLMDKEEKNLLLEKLFPEALEGDCAFLLEEESDRFLQVCCGMANGNGGWIIWGIREDSEISVQGVRNAERLENYLKAILQNQRDLSWVPNCSYRTVSVDTKDFLILKIEPAKWENLPVYLRQGVFRRFEGVNILSGQTIRWRMALDALESSRCDFVIPSLTAGELDEDALGSFREKVTTQRTEWKGLSRSEFLKRTLVTDENENVTCAGWLLLGKESARVFLIRHGDETTEEVLEAKNLWSAFRLFPPLFCTTDSETTNNALQECFVNALVHAEHDAESIRVTWEKNKVIFVNPGLPRTRTPGESVPRNYRLMHMFKLAGIARGNGEGLGLIRKHDNAFRLVSDVLELRTLAELTIPYADELKGADAQAWGWMPVALESTAPIESFEDNQPTEVEADPEEKLDDKRDINTVEHEVSLSEKEVSDVLLEPAEFPKIEDLAEGEGEVLFSESESEALPAELDSMAETPEIKPFEEEVTLKASEPTAPQKAEFGDAALELQEYLSVLNAEDSDEQASHLEDVEYSPNVNAVRTASRPSTSTVKDAILELCTKYRSLPELAKMLVRSEASLRRNYITSMVREGLLEAEFPDKAGHSDQRYRARNSSDEL